MVTVEERARKGERVYIFSEMTFVTSLFINLPMYPLKYFQIVLKDYVQCKFTDNGNMGDT